jgi:2-polyprenyl-6-methoxyphenol hydroxylase-like FAD-dependent oxidoreductase
MDVLWFKLPREKDDPEGIVGRIGRGHIAIMLDREDYWQAGYVIPKGTYPELRHEGIEALHRGFAELIPEFADRIEHLKDWQQASLLSVESSRCPRWYRPGLLLIGDAAHVMSPVGGVGINYAIQDAVVAANVLGGPLKSGRLQSRHLAAVQRRREWSTRLVQGAQSVAQRWVVSGALSASEVFKLPVLLRLLLRTPLLRDLFAYLIAFGAWPVHTRGESASVSSGWENHSAQEMKRIAEIGGLGQNERRKDPGRRSLRQGRRRGRRGAARGRVRGAGAGAPG